MTALTTLIVLLVILTAAALPFIIRSILWSRITRLSRKERYPKIVSLLQSALYKVFFHEADRNEYCFYAYLAQGDDQKAEEYLRYLMKERLTSARSYQIAKRSYFYFIDSGNKEICQMLLPLIEAKAERKEYAYCRMLYRILLEKKAEDLSLVQDMLEQKEKEIAQDKESSETLVQIGILQYLLALQLSYQHHIKQAKHYLQKAKKNLKGTPYDRKIKKLLSSL